MLGFAAQPTPLRSLEPKSKRPDRSGYNDTFMTTPRNQWRYSPAEHRMADPATADGNKPDGKPRKKHKKQKDSQLIIRINREERDNFVDLCDELDTSAAREIRRFIRGFMREQNRLKG